MKYFERSVYVYSRAGTIAILWWIFRQPSGVIAFIAGIVALYMWELGDQMKEKR